MATRFVLKGQKAYAKAVANCRICPGKDGDIDKFEVVLDGENCLRYSTSGLCKIGEGYEYYYLRTDRDEPIELFSGCEYLGRLGFDSDGTLVLRYPVGVQILIPSRLTEVYLLTLDLIQDGGYASGKGLADALRGKLIELTKLNVDFIGSESCDDILSLYNDAMANRRRTEREYKIWRSVAERLQAMVMPTRQVGDNGDKVWRNIKNGCFLEPILTIFHQSFCTSICSLARDEL